MIGIIRHTATWLAVVAALPLLLSPDAAHAQEGLSRLDSASRAAILDVVDSARAAGLPTEPLVSKTLEGVSKGAPGARIVAVVRGYARALGAARRVLGPRAAEVDVIAGAGALQAGVAAERLREMARTRGGSGLAVPLVVLSDLVARGVPPDTASAAVLAMWRGGAGEADFVALRARVEQDIRSGVPPAAAAMLRARGFPQSPPGATGRPR